MMSSLLLMADVTRRADPCRFCFFSGIKLMLKLIATVSHMTTFNVLHYCTLFAAVNCHTTFC